MTAPPTALATAAPEEGAAVLRRVPGHRSALAGAIAVGTVAAAGIWAVLAVANGRSLDEVVSGYELLGAVVGVTFGVVGAVVLRQRPSLALGWLFVFEGALQSAGSVLVEYAARPGPLPLAGAAAGVGEYVWLPGMAMAAALFAPLFPDGRPRSRRWRPVVWVGVASVVVASAGFALLSAGNDLAGVVTIGALLTGVACGVIGAGGLVVTMVHATGDERARIAWFFTAFAVVVVAQLLPVNPLVPTVAAGLVPVALGVAMLRHRLFDGDRLLNRTLVYGVLTGLIVALFALCVGLASNALGGQRTGAVVAAVVVALGLSPARSAVQRGVDRLLYGGRCDPYAALTTLSRQLSASILPDELLRIVVTTVTSTLRLPYAAMTLAGDAAPATVSGEPVGATVDLAVTHAGVHIGALTIGLPPGQRFLDPGDERLLLDLVRQAGAAAAAVRLTHELTRSRDDLAVARDEERHRIRRDLHDGLGPTLAGVALGIGAARRTVLASHPETADLLGQLETDVRDSLDDVRRLVADLVPVTLEQLGLPDALRQYAEAVTTRSQGALKVRVQAPATRPDLGSRVELAAYRIVMEAVTNTARHAGASRCDIDVAADGDELRLSILDNGAGLPASARSGLGLRSMTERATELGGSCRWSVPDGGGALVTVVLPLGGVR